MISFNGNTGYDINAELVKTAVNEAAKSGYWTGYWKGYAGGFFVATIIGGVVTVKLLADKHNKKRQKMNDTV